MESVFSLLQGQQVLPLVQVEDVDTGLKVSEAMMIAGMHSVEVVLRTENSLAALTEIKAQFPDLSVGAGTVLTTQILDKALTAGADYIVTPAVTPNLLAALSSCGKPVIPGVSKPSDIALVYEHGMHEMKLFPAELSGGPAFLKAIGGVFQDVNFCPTGGINQHNVKDYLALNNVSAVGGSWLCKPEWVLNSNWQAITKACIDAKS